MVDQEGKKKSQVQADNSSVATGDISIGGNVAGNFHIGNIYGLSTEETTRLFGEMLSKVEKKDFTGECPYKGLDFFEESDAELFFGREKLVDELLNRVKASRTVFITGASGSGKSSLVRAGLIPALKKGGIKTSKSNEWVYASMKPGREPFKALTASLSRIKMEVGDYFEKNVSAPEILHKCTEALLSESANQRFVLFIDQFEEVFTQINAEEERNSFLELLTKAAVTDGGRLIILFTMRSDFVPNCARYPKLNDLLNQQFIQIGAMQPEELVRAISLPALHVGLDIKPDLVAQIINEMNGEPGALPLMQFALKDLFDALQEKGQLKGLTLEAYLERGGIHKALERHADKTFASLSESEQNLTRSIFSGLIEVGRGSQDTKRTANFEELISAETERTAVDVILQKLANARLVTLDSAGDSVTVTLAHEKLLSAWTWLRKLVYENRDVIAVQNEIINDAKGWDENQRDDSFLYRGARLANAREKLNAKKLTLSGLGMEFVQAGERAYTDALEQEKKRVEQLEQLNRVSLARQLAAQAQSLISAESSKEMTALLLATQSMKLSPSAEAAELMLGFKTTSQSIAQINDVNIFAFSPNGQYIVSSDGSAFAHLWDASNGKEITRLEHKHPVGFLSFSSNGTTVVSISNNIVHLWGIPTGKELISIPHDSSVDSAVVNHDQNYMVSVIGDIAYLWDVKRCKQIAQLRHESNVHSVIFIQDGKLVLTENWKNYLSKKNVHIWDVATGKEFKSLTLLQTPNDNLDRDGELYSVAISPNGKYLLAGGYDNKNNYTDPYDPRAELWDINKGNVIKRHVYIGDVTPVNFVKFSPDSRYMVSANGDSAGLWEVESGKLTAQFTCDAKIESVEFSHQKGGQYMAIKAGRIVEIRDTSTGSYRFTFSHDETVNSIEFSSNDNFVITGSNDNTVFVHEISTKSEIARKNLGEIVTSVGFANDAFLSALGKTIHIWRTGSGTGITSIYHEKDEKKDRMIVVGNNADKIDFVLSHDGNQCITWSDKTIRIWETATGKETASISLDKDVRAIALSPDSMLLASIVGLDDVYIWETSTSKQVKRIKSDYYPNAVEFNPNGEVIYLHSYKAAWYWDIVDGKIGIAGAVVISPDKKYTAHINADMDEKGYPVANNVAGVIEASTGRKIISITHDEVVTSIEFSPDSRYVLSRSKSGELYIGDIGEEKITTHFPLNFETEKLFCSPDGTHIVTVGNSIARIWETATGKEIKSIHENNFQFIGFTRDNGSIITADQEVIQVWNISNGKVTISIKHNGNSKDISTSPNSQYLYSKTKKNILFWKVSTGKIALRLQGNGAKFVFSSNEEYISSWEGKTARVWELSSGNEIGRMHHSNNIDEVTFSPNGKYIISRAGRDIRVWLWQPNHLISRICSATPRNLTRAEWDQYIGDALPYQAVCENLSIEP